MQTDKNEGLQKQQRRLSEIYEARQEVAERKQRAFELLATNQLSYRLASRFFQEAVETYLIESEHVITQALPDVDTEDWSEREQLAYQVWYEAQLGEMQLNRGTRRFSGLLDYLEVDGDISETWEEESDSYMGTGETETRTETHQIPFHISKRAWRVCNYWWAEVGMDFELPVEEDDETEFTMETIEKIKNGNLN